MSLIYEVFPGKLHNTFECLEKQINRTEEIRLRVNRPVTVMLGGAEYFVSKTGQLIRGNGDFVTIDSYDMESIVNHICNSSPYAYEEEIKRGYITIKGGHRVGLSGQAVMTAEGSIKTIKNISFLNIRIAHEVRGSGERFLSYLYEGEKIHNTLIISPPGFGKTTLLRDLIRMISDGNHFAKGKNCTIIDERSELAGSYNGIPQLDVGIRTDVMDSCPKALGMMMAVRSMAPQIMAVDEMGTAEDIRALFSVIRTGCSILATMHGDSMESLVKKSFLKEVMDEKVFSRYIIIKNRHREWEILDEELRKC